MSRLLCAVCFAVILLACSDQGLDPAFNEAGEGFVWANGSSCSPSANGVDIPAPKHDSLPPLPPSSFPDQNARWQRIAEHVPGGWAGLYLEPVAGGTRLVVNFVDVSHISASLDALAVQYPLYVPGGAQVSFARDAVRVRGVRWNWVQLNDWYRYVLQVGGLPNGWTYSDINEVSNRLELGAATTVDRGVLLERLSQLGVPCWLVAIDIVGYAVPFSPRPPSAGSGVVAP